MTGRGGKRPGAGRKPGIRHLTQAQSPIRIAEMTLARHLPELVDIAIQMAVDGDRAMIVYCIDRVLGRAVQPISLVDAVRAMAAQEGLTDEETAAAVAEAERIMKAPAHARR